MLRILIPTLKQTTKRAVRLDARARVRGLHEALQHQRGTLDGEGARGHPGVVPAWAGRGRVWAYVFFVALSGTRPSGLATGPPTLPHDLR